MWWLFKNNHLHTSDLKEAPPPCRWTEFAGYCLFVCIVELVWLLFETMPILLLIIVILLVRVVRVLGLLLVMGIINHHWTGGRPQKYNFSPDFRFFFPTFHRYFFRFLSKHNSRRSISKYQWISHGTLNI